MSSCVVSYASPSFRRPRPRAFFLAARTQQVRSVAWLPELVRALLALGNVVLWATVLLAWSA